MMQLIIKIVQKNPSQFQLLISDFYKYQLKQAIKEVVDFCFKDRQDKYIAVTKYGETWVNSPNSYNISIDRKSLSNQIFTRSVFFQYLELSIS